jgi:hypothetical protein
MFNQSTLRLPSELDERLKTEARCERRSKNQQIVRILEERYGLTQEPDHVSRTADLSEEENQAPIAA